MTGIQCIVFHSVLTNDGWQVEENGTSVSRHLTQEDTERAAIANCRAVYVSGAAARAVLHKGDGQIHEERIFERDLSGRSRWGRRGRKLPAP